MKDIIIAPVITEKSQIAISENNVYTFKVSKDANKTQIILVIFINLSNWSLNRQVSIIYIFIFTTIEYTA